MMGKTPFALASLILTLSLTPASPWAADPAIASA